jgi:hypothetical protein
MRSTALPGRPGQTFRARDGRSGPARADGRRRARGRPLRAWAAGVGALGACALARPAFACPDCAAGRQARAQVRAEGFGAGVLAALVPFLIVGAASACAERVGRAPARPRPGPRGRALDGPGAGRPGERAGRAGASS